MSNLTAELQEVQYASFPEIFSKFKELSDKFNGLPADSLIQSFGMVNGFGSMYTPNPYAQNKRVKAISSLPEPYDKDKVTEMLKKPYSNEKPLREVEHALEFTAYPLFHMKKMYQDLLTYHSYVAPDLVDEEETNRDDFWREWKLLERLRKEMRVSDVAHEITGQALQEGKVFYYPRISLDKPHNKVNYAFMQQLPSDWIKIVGFNNKSKYTIAFNMMYFTLPGTDIRQFGDLFDPFVNDFNAVIEPMPKGVGKKIVYASKSTINMQKYSLIRTEDTDVYYQNGKWFYWVTLPIDKVFPFEIDDTNRAVVSPFTGLFLDLVQLAAYEAIQLEIVQNPLVALLTGEIPYYNTKDTNTADQYMLSNAGRLLFEAIFNEKMSSSNTGGIGLYAAPLQNMTLHTLSEAPSAMEISSNGYGYTISKAGLAGIVPTSGETRSGMAQISLKVESKFAQPIYRCFERMMNCLYENMKLKYDWKFYMFGDIATDNELEEKCRTGMTLGILPATIIYNALHGRSILDDIAWSDAVKNSKLLDKRIPLVSTYSAKNINKTETITSTGETKSPGRPESTEITSEGKEGDVDSPDTTETE